MKRANIINLAIVGAAVLIAGTFFAVSYITDTPTLKIETADGETHKFHLEIARTPDEQATGLMFREHLDEKSAMLFIFPTDAPVSFWMKNTLIPLDMIFITSDGNIAHIHKNAIPHDLSPIQPPMPVRYVLEIGGGISEKLGIEVGNRVKLPLLVD